MINTNSVSCEWCGHMLEAGTVASVAVASVAVVGLGISRPLAEVADTVPIGVGRAGFMHERGSTSISIAIERLGISRPLAIVVNLESLWASSLIADSSVGMVGQSRVEAISIAGISLSLV